jgi:pimeloyl-ACP methyl ester carboxylesterase
VSTPGATIHYLDWGGKGPTLVLLTGLHDNAHVFDELAPKLTPRYRVVAITRRGFGQSSRPESGYDVNSLVDDDIAVLDQLGLRRVYLAGHSIAGPEMTRLAVRYPERVARLAYLDASLNDRSELCAPARAEAPTTSLEVLSPPPPTEADFASFATAVDYMRRTTRAPWTAGYENSLWHHLLFNEAGNVLGFNTDDAIVAQVLDGACRYRHEFSQIQVPALAITAMPGTIFDLFPWLPRTVSGDSLATAEWYLRSTQEAIPHAVEEFTAGASQGTVLYVQNSSHYVFVQHQRQVVAALRDFLPAKRPGVRSAP